MLDKTNVKTLDKVVVRFPATPATACSLRAISSPTFQPGLETQCPPSPTIRPTCVRHRDLSVESQLSRQVSVKAYTLRATNVMYL